MSDRRDTPWEDERDRQRHHRPAVDRGHNVRSDDRSWPGVANGGGYQQSHVPYQGQPGQQYEGYDANGYGQQGHDANGYGQPGYDPNGYPPPGYGSQGYPDQNYAGQPYADEGYGQGYEGYPGGYGNQSQPGYGNQGQPGYDQPGYGQGYPDQGYEGYPGGYGGNGAPDQAYGDDGYGRGYAESYDPQKYPPDEAAGYRSAEYNTGSFIEQGFDADQPDPTTTSGRLRTTRPRGFDGTDTSLGRAYPGGPPTSGGGGRSAAPEPKRRKRKPVVLFMVLILLAVVAGGGYYGYGKVKAYLHAPDYSGMGTGDVKVKVAKGDSATAIAQTLLDQHVVKSTRAFIKAADGDPRSKEIEAGWYRLHEHMSAKNALGMLVAKDAKGNPTNLFVYKVTIPEGTISIDIYALLSQQTGIPETDFINAAKDPVALGVPKAWFTAKRDDGRPTVTATVKGFKYPAMIEGFLFPATYNFQPDETAKDMLSDMVAKFNDEMTSIDFLNLVKTHLGNIPPIEALIAASIAQKEATTPGDMAGVTKVLYNRVFKGLANGELGVDSETNYFLRMTGHDSKTSDKLKASELHDKNDPYNTHDVAGFPPGAISNPGEDALKAAVNPDPSKAGYAYFQTIGNNTKVIFSKTFAEFCSLNHSC